MYNFDLADDSQLFRHFAKTLLLKRCENNPYTTNQFANLIFSVGNTNNMALVSRITNAYRGYLLHEKDKQGNLNSIPIAYKEDAYLGYSLAIRLLNFIGRKLNRK